MARTAFQEEASVLTPPDHISVGLRLGAVERRCEVGPRDDIELLEGLGLTDTLWVRTRAPLERNSGTEMGDGVSPFWADASQVRRNGNDVRSYAAIMLVTLAGKMRTSCCQLE